MFTLKNLPYAYDALEPILSKEALEIHHKKHHQAYTDNFNIAWDANSIDKEKTEENLLALFSETSTFTKAFENHGGGFWNHTFFWESMRSPQENNIPQKGSLIEKMLDTSFGSKNDADKIEEGTGYKNFIEEFRKSSATLFGSGWAWLVYSHEENTLKIMQTSNQQNPLMDMVSKSEGKNSPLLVIDVWEHAYYVDYQNRRPDFIENFFQLIDWEKAEERLLSSQKKM